MSNSNTLTYSSELMKNYIHASVMDAEDAFDVLQDDKGNAILFSIGTDGVFNAIQNVPAQSNTNDSAGSAAGWIKHDLSSAQFKQDFPGQTVTCKTQTVAQDLTSGKMVLAMVASTGGTDTLYISTGNSASDTKWLSSPVWVQCPFNDPAVANSPSTLSILNIYVNETSSGQFVVVDIDSNNLVQRYYLNDLNTTPVWNKHALPIDLSADKPYSSCLGRVDKSMGVDGVYTFGSVNGAPQFMYRALWNAFGSGPVSPVLLTLPGASGTNNQAQAMAAFKNGSSDGATDLFVTATDTENKGLLYHFSSDMAGSPVSGVQVLSHDAFINVSTLHADLTNGIVTVWGLNSAHEVFYVTCAYEEIGKTASWSVPVPILTGVDMISPYVNKENDGNTIFASDGQRNLYILTKSPETGMWSKSQITLPAASAQTKAISFSSYTTTLNLTGDNQQPVANTPLKLSAATRTGFYINNLYTVLDTTPIEIDTDVQGTITIIEAVGGLQGTKLTVSEPGGNAITINPMDKPFKKAAALKSAAALSSAVITNPVDGSTKPLVAAGTSQQNLEAVAKANGDLQTAYHKFTTTNSATSLAATPELASSQSVLEGIAVGFGDLCNWLESGVDAIVHLAEDVATGLYHFVVTIAGDVYHAVLDCVEKVVGAIEWIYNKIKTGIEDLIKFLEFLFDWQDIKRTKEVMANLASVFLKHQISQLGSFKTEVKTGFSKLKTDIDKWSGANFPEFSSVGGSAVSSQSTPNSHSSTSSNMLSHHFKYNAGSSVFTMSDKVISDVPEPLTQLFKLLKTERHIVTDLVTGLKQLFSEIDSLTPENFLKQLCGLIADALLETVENVTLGIIDVLVALEDGIIEILSVPLYIPVVSDILSDIGVSMPSLLDIFSWLVAIPTTLIYKVIKGSAPFPEGSQTQAIIDASTYSALLTALGDSSNDVTKPVAMTETDMVSMVDASESKPSGLADAVFYLGHMASAITTIINAAVGSMEAVAESGDNPLAKPSAILSIFSGIGAGVADAVVPYDPETNSTMNDFNKIILGIRVAFLALFSGPSQKYFLKLESDVRPTGALIDALLTVPQCIGTVSHFVELASDPAGTDRSIAIIDETSNVVSYITRIIYAAIVISKDEELAIGYVVSSVCYSGLQIAEASLATD